MHSNIKPRRRPLQLAVLAALGTVALMPSLASAADRYWTCDSGSWDALCWSSIPGGAPTLGQPVNGDTVHLVQSDGVSRKVSYANKAFPSAVLSALTIDATGKGAMTLTQTKDPLTSTNETIGDAGTGGYAQSGGTNTVDSSLVLGNQAAGKGAYSLSGTGSLSALNEVVGDAGIGIFTQSGGTNTIGNMLRLGVASGSSGTYNLIGGSLSVTASGIRGFGDETVGYLGTGVFNQSGGTHAIIGNLTLGGGSGSSGTYNLNGGTLVLGGDIRDGFGTGELVLNGGTLMVGSASGSGSIAVDNLVLGKASGTNVSFTQTSDGLYQGASKVATSFAGDLTLGGAGTGNFMLSGAPSAVGNLTINKGTYQLAAGSTLDVNGSLINNDMLSMAGGTLASGATLVQGATGILSGRGTVSTSVSNAGTVSAKSGNLIVNGSSFTNTGLVKNSVGSNLFIESATVSNQGNIEVNSAGSVVFDAAISNTAGKNVTLLGGTLAMPTLTNAAGGTVKGFGTLTGNLANAGAVEFYGPTNIVGDLANQAGATLLVRNDQTLITGHTVNDGIIQTLKGTVMFEGGLTNNGVYLSDPSDNYFTDLLVSQTGYLVGEAGDNFFISGDFENYSLQNTLWNTGAASLFFNGAGAQNLYLAGADLGAVASGYGNNFAWGSFSLGSGVTATLWDSNGDPGAALYVGAFALGGGLDQLSSVFSDYNIYYDPTLAANAYLGGQTYALNGTGYLMAVSSVPVPAAFWLFGSGLVGLVAVPRRKCHTAEPRAARV